MLGLHDIKERLNPILKSPRHALLDSKSKGSGNDSLNRTAAVLIIIHSKNHIPHIILTRRSSMLRSHSGEISFPGGQYSPEEDLDLLDTALRETKEELGLGFRPENIQGRLNSVNTLTSNFTIVPFITLRKRIPEPSIFTNEVECIVDIPLQPTLATYQPDFEHYHISRQDVYKFMYRGVVIWGATARILKQLYACLCA
jgi:8-oxo-dGTP pyrophosphatase MutT (NUDIX family)